MKDDSARNRALGKPITARLRAGLRSDGRGCPEAETLAAYAERTLTCRELEACELHLAACALCQEAVATLARLSEAEQPVEVLAAAPPRRIPWFRWALAAPALIALVVAGLWYTGEFRPLLRQEERAAQPSPPPTPPTVAVETQAEPAKPEQETLSAKAKVEPQKKATYPAPASMAAATERAPGEELAAAPSVAAGAGAGARPDALTGIAEARIVTPTERARLATAEAPAAPAKELARDAAQDRFVADAAPAPATADAPQAQRLEKSAELESKAQGGMARDEQVLAESAPGRTASFAAAGAMAHRVSALWRVGAKGLIQKADSEGQWMTQTSGVSADLFAIAFSSDSVAWAVGEAGLVLRTTDGGMTWQRTESPTSEDLVRAVATSELTARVVTRRGRVYATADGGKSWNLSRPD